MSIFVFTIFGPLLGVGVFLVEDMLLSGRIHFTAPDGFWFWFMYLAYLFGAPPALFTGIVDWVLSWWMPRWLRFIVAAGVGFGTTIVMSNLVFSSIEKIFGGVVLAGLIGAIPAAVCSWLSSAIRES
jgi:hypothetical protein